MQVNSHISFQVTHSPDCYEHYMMPLLFPQLILCRGILFLCSSVFICGFIIYFTLLCSLLLIRCTSESHHPITMPGVCCPWHACREHIVPRRSPCRFMGIN